MNTLPEGEVLLEATAMAERAIWGHDGRGMIGRDRHNLKARVTKAIAEALNRTAISSPLASTAGAEAEGWHDAVTGGPDTPPQISPLSWLKEAIDELHNRGPADDCDDPDAYHEMIREVEALHDRLTALAASPPSASQAGEHLYPRLAFKAGWRTNADRTGDQEYLDGCERVDWEEFKARGLTAYLDALNNSTDETCENCRWCFGPIFLHCGCKGSEFYDGMVMPDGGCSHFARRASQAELPACFDNHHKYVGKCPYCHTKLPVIASQAEGGENG